MTFATALLAYLERYAARAALPRVHRLLLPPPRDDSRGKAAEFCALELDDGSIGMSYVLLDGALERLASEADHQGLVGAEALSVARGYADPTSPVRALGFAAINAITQCLFQRAGYAPLATSDSLGLLDPQPGDHIGMIGLFPGLTGPIVATGARLTVIELKPELAGERESYRVTLDTEALRECNKILSTSTVLLNDTLDTVLAHCASATRFAMVGPGAGCLPDPLFARGVTLLGGTRVSDPEGFRWALQAGESWGRYTCKYAIRREEYPGFEALLRYCAA